MIPSNTRLGILRLEEVFEDYDGPQLYSCINNYGQKFLVLHAPPSAEKDNWLFLPISAARLLTLKRGGRTLLSAFTKPAKDNLELVSYSEDGTVTVANVSPNDLPADFFPAPNVYLIDDPLDEVIQSTVEMPEFSDLDEYIMETQINVDDEYKYVQNTEQMPAAIREPFPMWEINPEVINYLKSIRTPVQAAAEKTRRIVFDITFRSGELRTDLSLVGLSGILSSVQRLVDSIWSSVGRKAAGKHWAPLDAVAVFPGSFGLRVESHAGALMIDAGGAKVYDALLRLFHAKTNKVKLRLLFDELGGHTTLTYKAFAKALRRCDADFHFELGVPGSTESRIANLNRTESVRLVDLLEAGDIIRPVVEVKHGRLVAANLKTKLFLVQIGSELVGGRIAKECLPQMSGKQLDMNYELTIKSTQEISESTNQTITKHVLLKISAD
jgi:hypothetical protein